MKFKYLLKIFIIAFLILSFIIFLRESFVSKSSQLIKEGLHSNTYAQTNNPLKMNKTLFNLNASTLFRAPKFELPKIGLPKFGSTNTSINPSTKSTKYKKLRHLIMRPIHQMSGAKSFCKTYTGGVELEDGCNRITQSNCNLVDCCVRVGNKCKAGNINGSIFNADKISHYWFKNKCYGDGC